MFAKIHTPMFTAIALCFAPSAVAQTTVPLPSNIDDRLRIQGPAVTEADRQNALMTGDTDIVLLQKTKLFTLHGSLASTYSSNAALSPDDRKKDVSGQAQLGLRIGTRIARRVDVFADFGVLGVRYAKLTGLDYNALTAAVGAQVSVKSFDLYATYQPSMIYNRGFGKRQLTQHRFRMGLSRRFTVGPVVVDPSISGERVVAHPSDYSNWAGSADLTLSTALSKKRPLSLYATGGYERRVYDNYFPDLVGTKRKDNRFNGGVGLTYALGRWGNANLAYDFQKNVSTSDVNGYVAHSGTLGLSARVRF